MTVSAVNTWAGGLASRRSGGSSVFYTWDPSGSISQRLDASGAVLSAYAVDAYGLRSGTDSSTADPYAGFGGAYGYYADAETGLSLLGHRYYDGGTGRFVTRDPIGYSGGPDLYAFCAGNPVMLSDPSGFCADPQSGEYGDGNYGWPDRLKNWADKHVRGGPPSIPGIWNNPLDMGRGLLDLPFDIEHLGSGTGAHFGDPSRVGWGAVGKDALTFTTVVSAGAGAAAGAGARGAAAGVEGAVEDGTTLYRGVNAEHPGYQDALNGEAHPIGGHNDPDLHVLGNTDSEFTSWTIKRSVAVKYANPLGSEQPGVVLQKVFSPSQMIDMGNSQGEILIEGPVTGATPTVP